MANAKHFDAHPIFVVRFQREDCSLIFVEFERFSFLLESARRCINLMRSFSFMKSPSTIATNYHISLERGLILTLAIVPTSQYSHSATHSIGIGIAVTMHIYRECSYMRWCNCTLGET